MNKTLKALLLNTILVAGTLVFSANSFAERRSDEEKNWPLGPPSQGKTEESSWAIGFDNDILVPGSRDQDYTYGINLTYFGRDVEDQWASLHRGLVSINEGVGLDNLIDSGIRASKIEYGLVGFTPEDISQVEAQSDDRPYASLVYVSSSREQYYPSKEVSWQSTLTVGVLGLDIVGDIQQGVHSALGGDQPMGWHNQISDGGEPTVRYSISRQNLLYKSGSGLELKSTIQASVGYITEASWSLSTRAGKIHTPWVSFNPELTTYGEKSIPDLSIKTSEQYAWAGISLKLRAYNVFLQGQFKESAVTYNSDEINHGLVEAWLGYTLAFADGYSITYAVRGHTSELKQGNGNRAVVWGGLLLSKTIG